VEILSNEILPLSTPSTAFPNKSVSSLLPFMMDTSYYQRLVERKRHNEDGGYNKLEGFHEAEIIYYFVHEEKHISKKNNRSEGTKREYLRDLLYFYQWCLDNVGANDDGEVFPFLKPGHIEQYQEELLNHYALSTCVRKITVIKSFLSFLHKNGRISIPLHQAFKRATLRMSDRPNRDIDYEDMKQIVDYYKNHPILHALLSVLMTTGIRIAELCTARVCDLTYDRRRNEYWLRVIGKGGKERDVLIFPEIFDRIVRFRERRGLATKLDANDTSPLFVTNKGKPYSETYLSRYITNAIKRTGLPLLKKVQGNITPHWFRHGTAIMLREAGADVREIQLYLGHESLRTTEIYLDRQMKKEKSAARKLNGFEF
jgi:integrase/recombinase XerD